MIKEVWNFRSRLFFPTFKAPSLGFPKTTNFIFFLGKQLHVEYEDTSNTETCPHSSATNQFNLSRWRWPTASWEYELLPESVRWENEGTQNPAGEP